MRIFLILLAFAAILGLLAGGAWWMYHIGYAAGGQAQAEKTRRLTHQIDTLQHQIASAVADAKDKWEAQVADAQAAVSRLKAQAHLSQVESKKWMERYLASDCAIAKQPLCPALQDY